MGALASLLMHLCLQNTSGWGGGEGDRDAAAGAPWAGGDGEQAGLGQRQSVPAGRVPRSDRPAEGNKGAAAAFSPALSQGSLVLGLWGQALLSLPYTFLSPCSPQRLARICTGTSEFPQNSLAHIYWDIMR